MLQSEHILYTDSESTIYHLNDIYKTVNPATGSLITVAEMRQVAADKVVKDTLRVLKTLHKRDLVGQGWIVSAITDEMRNQKQHLAGPKTQSNGKHLYQLNSSKSAPTENSLIPKTNI